MSELVATFWASVIVVAVVISIGAVGGGDPSLALLIGCAIHLIKRDLMEAK